MNNTATKESLAWSRLKSYSPSLYTIDDAPLVGQMSFAWQEFSKEIGQTLGLEGICISGTEINWRESNDITNGIAAPHMYSFLAASGIEGELYAVISKQHIEWLLAKILKIPLLEAQGQSPEIIESFYKFLSLEAVDIANTLQEEKKTAFSITPPRELKKETVLCFDIEVSYDNAQILIRIVMDNDFRKGWRGLKPKQAIKTNTVLSTTEVSLQLEVGRTWISLSELLGMEAGDFLLLDYCSYHGDTTKDRYTLNFHNKPLFSMQMEKGSLKILETPSHHEVYESMVNKRNPHDFDKDEDEDEELFTEETINDELTEENDDFSDVDLEEDEELGYAEEPLEEMEEVHEVPVTKEVPAAPSALATTSHAPPPQTNPRFTEPLTANDIPVCIVVQVAQLSMSVEKLLELQPGNLIDLNVAIENGVQLTVNGKIIARGELIKVGETIGVRILEIGT